MTRKTQVNQRHHYSIILVYEDDSEFIFEVILDGEPRKIQAELSMITRGTLMASFAKNATAYNDDGFDVCSYIR